MDSADDATAAAARARKERREAKIKAAGASRLNKITGLGGGLPRDVPPTTTTSSNVAGAATAAAAQQKGEQKGGDGGDHADPEEEDISQHYYQPQTANRIPPPRAQQPTPPNPMDMSEAQLRQLMLGLDPSNSGTSTPGSSGMGMPGMMGGMGMGMGGGGMDGQEDPMMKMMMQMLGGGANGGGMPGGNPFAGMPGMGGMPGMPGAPGQQQQAAVPDRYASFWRLLHTAVALGLGLYIALWTNWSGTKTERELQSTAAKSKVGADIKGVAGVGEEARTHFFWAFVTAEALLLTTRFFVDRTRAPPRGMLWSLSSFLPQPFRGYIEMGLRYGQMFSTLKSDILVCVFVLGVCSWLRA
ncbi:hypothetical protein QBC46DRAFT_377298 [Diplogelasinospora grovesii]|uniref:Uncharacterized protein n=1 Tax=Diplogelasinospora grovesii TaxID=303347 RepID=A0AAN6NCZ7_9PEZI|nr:hypothetical protein QBC46DRAFT_377298 [Diplogelasinospora grovesii]